MNAKSEEIPEELKKLQDNRALILLVELMGFLHDVGKLKTITDAKEPFKNHHFQWKEDKSKNKIDDKLDGLFGKEIDAIQGKKIEDFQNHHNPNDWIEKIIELADKKDSNEDRGKAISKQKDFKASVFGKESRLSSNDDLRCNFYNELTKCFGKWNFMVVNNEHFWITVRKDVISLMDSFLSKSVADTQRAANDVTLYDHSYMTGSIAKALVGKSLLSRSIQEKFAQSVEKRKASKRLDDSKRGNYKYSSEKERHIDREICKKYEELAHFDSECDLDLLIISFDGFGFISEVVNLLDIRGRKKVLEEIKDAVKELLEVEYPIGNCIYEDENNLCFLSLPLEDEVFDYLKKEVYKIFNGKAFGIFVPIIGRRQNLQYYGVSLTELKEESEKSIREGLIKDFEPKWIEEWKNVEGKEKCVVCGKLPQWQGKEKDYLCKFCWKSRYGANKKAEKEDSHWIDEIADENGKIAIVIGEFQPLDEWLSGELLEYQKIRTEKDLRNFVSGEINFEGASRKFIECFHEEMKRRGFVELLRSYVGNLDKRFEKEWKILGGGSKVGEIYYRLSEENQRLLKEQSQLSEEQINGIAQEVIKVTTKKPPSPSRLHRIWRELEEFSRNRIEEERGKIPKGKRLKFCLKEFKGKTGIYNAIIPEIGRIEVFYDGENKEFNTIERIDINEPNDETKRFDGDDFLRKHLDLEDKLKEVLKDNKIEIYKDKTKKGSFGVDASSFKGYKRFREILASPSGFLFITPQNEAIRISKSIKDGFNKEFSKVLGNISLNIGVVCSYRKFPIYITLDCARRMISEFNSFDFEEVKITKKEDSRVKLKVNDRETKMNISDKLGDGNKDYYYPYLSTVDGEVKHIEEIEADKLKLMLSRFDFEFLDSSSRRFEMMLNKNRRREHSVIGENGPRPYLLEDLRKMIELWNIMNEKLTHSQIKNLEYLCASKIEEWELKDIIGNDTLSEEEKERSEIFKEFVKSSVENICGKLSEAQKEDEEMKEKISQSIISGMFFDVIELFMTLKVKSLNPSDAIASALRDFQYTKEERRKAEEWLLNQVRKDPDWNFEEEENANR